MSIRIRPAVSADIAVLRELIDASVRGLQSHDYTPAQIEGALATVYGVDTQLISDGTYFVAETNAGANVGEKFRFVLDAEIAFELAGEVGAVTVFDQRRGPHHRRLSGSRDQRSPRLEQHLGDRIHDRLCEQLELHPQGVLARLRGIGRGKRASRRRFEIQRRELKPVRRRVDAKPIRNRQTGLPQRGLIGGLRTEAIGIDRLVRGQWNDQGIHQFVISKCNFENTKARKQEK